jgi:hypothetical protein
MQSEVWTASDPFFLMLALTAIHASDIRHRDLLDSEWDPEIVEWVFDVAEEIFWKSGTDRVRRTKKNNQTS